MGAVNTRDTRQQLRRDRAGREVQQAGQLPLQGSVAAAAAKPTASKNTTHVNDDPA